MKQMLRKNIAGVLCMILCFLFTHSGFAYYEPMAQADPTDKVIEIEAEDFGGTDKGFSIVEDSEASGGKIIVGGGNIENEAVYELPIEGYGEDLVVYVYHKADSTAGNLSFIAIDGFESNEIYADEIGKWCVSRFYYGEILGTHTLKISNARKGHKIDKLVVKYNQRKFEKSEDDWYGEYWQGNDAVKDLQIKEIEERTTGSFFIEAEDGMEGFDGNFGTGKVGYEEGTSNGAYWYNDTSVAAYLDPLADDSYSARYKFYVSQPGTYWLWVRCYKPRDLWKSTWFGIDNKDYVRVDQGTMEQWQWVKHYSRNLDVGWHTLDMKYRQSGHRIDCMILTMISTFTPQGIGSLPGEPPPVSDAMQQNYEKSRNGSKVRGFNTRLHADAPIKNDGRNIYAPANNIAQVMGIEFEEHDGYYLLKENRNYLKIYPNEKRFVANGMPKSIGAAPYMVESNCMIPISMVEQAFDIDSYYLEKENALFVFYKQQENYRKALPDELEIIEEEDDGSLFVKLPHDNPDAKVEFWIRRNNTDANILEMNNFDGSFKIISTEYNYNQFGAAAHRQLRQMSWQRMSDPYYKDGAFYARKFELWSGATYDIKVRITENNKEDVFVAEKAYRSTDKVGQIGSNLDIYKLLELAGKVTNGELLATPTFENIGYYIDTDFEDMAKCDVTFRKVGDSQWEKAYKPFFDEMPNQFRGSIVNLEPDTEYEINAKIYDSQGRLLTDKSTVTKTWSENPNIGTRLKLSDVYDGKGTLYLQDIQGTDDAWVELDCEGETISAGVNETDGVFIANCRNLILKNAVIKGGRENGIIICAMSKNIRIQNCDISEWGPGDAYYDEDLYLYFKNGEPYNWFAGIGMYMAENVVVERCYIHDANAQTNPWRMAEDIREHPCGVTGLYLKCIGGTVIRYNNIIGSDEHRFNDVIEGNGNNGYWPSSTGWDSDVYGNMLCYGNDDSTELDGGQMNVRFYKNRIEGTMVGLSLAANNTGPSYIFNNLFTNMGDIDGYYTSAFKSGGRYKPTDPHVGYMFLFNNTVNRMENSAVNTGVNGTDDYHATTRNNLFNTTLRCYYNSYTDYRDDNDYNMFALPSTTGYKGTGDPNSLFETAPDYQDEAAGNYNLKEGSAGIDSGEVLDNFSKGYTGSSADMGALEYGGEIKFIPYRPVDFSADRYYAEIKDGEELSISVRIGDIKDATKFSIKKNEDFDWIEIVDEESLTNAEIVPNSEVTFKVRIDMTKSNFEKGNGMVLFMLDNGYAIPITIVGKRS